jgi:hypothetical protein
VDAPTAYKNAGLGNLIGGLFSAFTAFAMLMSLIWVCIGVFWLIPLGASCWQAFVGWQMYQGQPVANAKTASIVGVVSALCSFNMVAAMGGGFAMMQFNEPDVAGWLETSA